MGSHLIAVACAAAVTLSVSSAQARGLIDPQCYSCEAGNRLCAGRCVTLSDPRYGCAGPSCAACSLPHAIATCGVDGRCAIAECTPGWADCDGDPANGCEADLSSATTCTSCTIACSGDTGLCSPTGCVAGCTPPLTQCGRSCVDLARSPMHCGSCTAECEAPGGFPTCSAGQCGTPDCPAGLTVCQGRCVDTQTDRANCGECAHNCPGFTEGLPACSAGVCTVACLPGTTFCGSACKPLDSDPANCGACGSSCQTGEYCSFGTCLPRSSVWLATGLSAPEDIVVDATTVYWTSPGDNTIRSIDKMGGTVIRLADALSPPRRLALDEAYVYWSEDLGGAIMRTRKDGSGTPELVTPAITPLSIVVDSANVYWGSGLNVMTAPKTGGGPVTTFAVLPSDRSRDIVDIKSDGATLFVMDRFPSAGGTWKVELRDGSVSLFLHHGSAVRPSVSALDSTRFYQSGGENIRTIGWVDKADGRNPGLNVYWGVSIEYVAVTACDILWTNTQQLNLSLRDAGGQESPAYWTIFTVDASQVPVRRMAVDESNLYWTSASAIGKIPAR